ENIGEHAERGLQTAAADSGAVAGLHMDVRGDAVANGIVARREQCLRIEVDRRYMRCAEFQRGNSQDPRAASIVDDAAAAQGQGIQYLQTERRGGMGAGTERKPGI